MSAPQVIQRVGAWGVSGTVLLVQTFCLLLAARLALAWVPVRRVVAWKQRPMRRESRPAQDLARDLQQVRRAVLVVSRYGPVRFVCFPQCLAASELLRARGIESRLHYGVARADDKLVTHTWLEAGGEVVIGGEVASEFSTLAVY